MFSVECERCGKDFLEEDMVIVENMVVCGDCADILEEEGVQ